MKIGLSFSRCVLDIVEGRVDINDVLVVVARTDFNPTIDDQWKDVWIGYGGGGDLSRSVFSSSLPEWSSYSDDDEEQFRKVSIDLWEQGKLHQPRKFGAHPRRMPYYWLETVLPSEELEDNPAAKMAWEKFKSIAGLTNVTLDKGAK